MEEFVKGEEKTYILQAEPVEKENEEEQEPVQEDIVKNEKDSAEENSNPEIHDTPTEDSTLQEAAEQEEELHELPKKIEVVTGNANDLKISHVSDYLEMQKPKEENIKGNIIIPEEKK